MSESILFYAAAEDLASLCQAVEDNVPLRYAFIQTYASLPIPLFSTYREIPDFGYAKYGNMFREESLLVVNANDTVVAQPLERQDGVRILSVSAVGNIGSVDFIAAGTYGENTVIQSSIGTFANHANSKGIWSVFKQRLRAISSTIGGFSVMAGAAAVLRQGGRLTQSAKLPPNRDLSGPVGK